MVDRDAASIAQDVAAEPTAPPKSEPPKAARTFQPLLFGRGCQLEPGPRLLVETLANWRNITRKKYGKEYSFAKQPDLAKELNVSVRTIQIWLKKAKRAGYIVIRRTRTDGNHYYILDPDELEKARLQAGADCASQGATDCASQGATDCASQGAASTIGLNDRRRSNQTAASASELFIPAEIQLASHVLQELDFPRPAADEYAEKDAQLATLAAEYVRHMRLTKPRDRKWFDPGTLRGILNKPRNWFFEHVEGKWKLPPDGPRAPGSKTRDQLRADFRMVSPAKIAEIWQHVRAAHPDKDQGSKQDGTPLTDVGSQACIAELLKRGLSIDDRGADACIEQFRSEGR